jgi:hypothetical protein
VRPSSKARNPNCRKIRKCSVRIGQRGFPVTSDRKQQGDPGRPSCADQIVATIKAVEAGWSGRKVELIIIDTLAKAIASGGGDENSARDANIAHANLRRVLVLAGVQAALIGHTGKDPSRGAARV